MARYIDAEKLCKDLMDMARYQPIHKQSTIFDVVSTIKHFPTADVAPRAEVAREIFEEIESLFPSDKKFTTISRVTINRLKKKYTNEVQK